MNKMSQIYGTTTGEWIVIIVGGIVKTIGSGFFMAVGAILAYRWMFDA